MLSPFTNRCVYFRCIYASPIWFNHLSYDGVLRWLVWLDLWKSEVSPNTNLNMCYVFFFCYRNGAKCQSHWNNRKQKVKCNEDVNFWYTSNWRRVKKITKVAIWTGFPEKSNLFERGELTRKERLKLRSGPIFRFFFCRGKSLAREMKSIITKSSEKSCIVRARVSLIIWNPTMSLWH